VKRPCLNRTPPIIGIQLAVGISVPRALRSRLLGMLAMRLFELLRYLLPCAGVLYALVAIALARRGAMRAVWGAWLLGPVALTIALAAWAALTLTAGIIPFHRWLLFYTLAVATPAVAAGLVATGLSATRLARRWLILHVLATLAVFAIAYRLGAGATTGVVELIQTVQ
jgi:hypothetical protein